MLSQNCLGLGATASLSENTMRLLETGARVYVTFRKSRVLGLGATASLSERLLYSVGEKSVRPLSRVWSHDRQSEGFQSLIENSKEVLRMVLRKLLNS